MIEQRIFIHQGSYDGDHRRKLDFFVGRHGRVVIERTEAMRMLMRAARLPQPPTSYFHDQDDVPVSDVLALMANLKLIEPNIRRYIEQQAAEATAIAEHARILQS